MSKSIAQINTDVYQKGVSYVELLLVVGLFVIIAAGAIPFASGFLIRNDLKNKTNEVVSSLREAQIYSISLKDDSSWGVYIDSSEIVLFKGNDYATRDQNFDQTFAVPNSMSITSSEIVFEKLSGNTSSQTIVVSNNLGESNTVSINDIGIVDVN